MLGVLLTSVPAAFSSESGPTIGSRRWNGRTVRIALSDSLSRQSAAIKFGSDARLAALAAAQSWSAVSGVEFRLVSSSIESISEAGTKGDGVSLITVAGTLKPDSR